MMVCPQCQQSYRQNLHCPQCNVRLLYQANGLTDSGYGLDDMGEWQQTPWGKIVVGLVLAQGLCYGLQNLLLAGVSATGDTTEVVWRTLWGLVLLHALQGVSLIAGGTICGAGQARGVLYGSLVGLANGLIYLATQRNNEALFSPAILYTIPVVHLALGALGGLLGRLIWRPAVLVLPATDSTAPSFPVASAWSLFSGPVHLGRSFAGIFVVVAGVVWSNAILEFVLHASNGSLTITSHLQAQLVGWEITALATLLGAGFAGATTFNGLKNGLCVGLGASVVIIGVQLSSPKFSLDSLILTVASILVLTLAGGWFGGQLFPPVYSGKRPRISTYA